MLSGADFYRQVIDRGDKGNVFGRRMGIRAVEITEGFCCMEMPVTPEIKNPIGSIHGGALYTLADCAAGGASWSYGERMTTLGSDFHFLRPGLGAEKIIAEGRVLKHGRKVTVVEVSVMDQDRKELCAGIFTCMGIGIPLEGQPEESGRKE